MLLSLLRHKDLVIFVFESPPGVETTYNLHFCTFSIVAEKTKTTVLQYFSTASITSFTINEIGEQISDIFIQYL